MHIMCLEKIVDFFRRAPPEVVVALEQDLFPGQRLDKLKVRQRLLHRHAPRKIAAEHADILVMQCREAETDLLHIVFPRPAKHVHGLVSTQ